MNCQEFRAKWPHHDEAALSHASECADCLHWVESLASEEEVLFMKDVPQPPSQLEERIMRAIYQAAAHSPVPPRSAARDEHGDVWKRTLFRRAYVWTGAAGFLLAVGLWGLAALEQNREAAQQASQADAVSGAARSSVQETSPASPAPEGGESAALRGAAASNPALSAPSPDTPVSSPAGNTSLQTPKTMASQPSTQASGAVSSARRQPADSPLKAEPAPPVQPEIAADHASPLAGQANVAEAARQKAAVPPADAPSVAAAPDRKMDVQAHGFEPISQHQPQAQGITVSTFKDAQSAALVSDLPVPEAKVLPQGFVLRSLSVHYASETSPAVTHISAVYQREGDAVISLEVDRNDGERPLSIPGTFARREVFSIDGRQAIGVTFHSPAGAPAEHAVHVILEKDGIPLYVTATARGVSLPELMEVVKQLEWKKS